LTKRGLTIPVPTIAFETDIFKKLKLWNDWVPAEEDMLLNSAYLKNMNEKAPKELLKKSE
jgi:hypothetical protein